MRKILILISVLLAACAAPEEEVLTTSVDVNQSDLAALLSAVDALSDNELPLDAMLELAVSTPMDDEKQERFAIAYNGSEEEILYHIWREQVDWVHVYFSSTSKNLVAAIEKANAAYARD
jgi:hypothetical protein